MGDIDLHKEQKMLDTTIRKIKDSTYLLKESIENKNSQLKTGNFMIGDNKTLRNNKIYKKTLEEAIETPYFGSFEMTTKKVGHEKFYIGKHGINDKNENMIVVDWRMPISDVYYNYTPENPKQTYKVVDEKRKREYEEVVNILNKREITIKNRKVLKISQQAGDMEHDSNVTVTDTGSEYSVTDDFLLDILKNSETTGYVKEIIATIQKEQNRAIRVPINYDLIVQGVAGSGKSSIALHRLSYLLFNNKLIKPENVLILGPSNLFISSVKDLLPNLELDHIQQSTISDLIINELSTYLKKVNIEISTDYYFEDLLFGHKNDFEKRRIEFKGSKLMVDMLDEFLLEYIKQFPNRIEVLRISDFTLTRNEQLKIYDGFQYLPFTERVEKFIQQVINHFNDKRKKKIKEIQEKYEMVCDFYSNNSSLMRAEINVCIEKANIAKNYKISSVEKEFKQKLNTWKNKITGQDILTIYKQFLSYEVLDALSVNKTQNVAELFRNHKLEEITYFDLAPLFYIYLSMFKKPKRYMHIVVDEAQDLSYTHYAALKKITKTMTILGDKDQSIFMKYGQTNWEQLNDTIFYTDKTKNLSLDNSYRSTKEIIDAGNTVLSNNQGILHTPIIPLNRSGESVKVREVMNGEELFHQIVINLKRWQKKYKRIAIIHKTEKKARALTKKLAKEFGNTVAYVSPEQEIQNNKVSVLASYNTKGMEFDAVLLVNVNEKSYPNDELHSKLLYVLLTRAQQEVTVYYNDMPSPLLEGLLEKQPVKESIYDEIL